MDIIPISIAADPLLSVPNIPLSDVSRQNMNIQDAQWELPGRPDATIEPAQLALWDEMLREDTIFVSPELARPKIAVRVGPVYFGYHPGRLRNTVGRGIASSRNWSGAVVRPSNGRRFKSAAGRWTVPDVVRGHPDDVSLRNSPGFAGHGEPLDHKCSIWVGLDGNFGWADSMPQLGTEHTEHGTHILWFQWWHPKSMRFQVYVTNPEMLLNVGDEVICSLEALDTQTVRFNFLRISAATGERFFTSVQSRAEDQRPLLGSTAQAILERPSEPYLDRDSNGKLEARDAGRHPMCNFGEVAFTAFAATADKSGDTATREEYGLATARLYKTTTTLQNPIRTRVVSRPSMTENRTKLKLKYM